VLDLKSDKGFMNKAWDLQHKIEARQERLGKGKYGRVLKMARNPTNEEYARTSKITGIGILAVGGIGFIIYLFRELLVPFVLKAFGY
jgi:protein transport protein SEC61 subunit gamma-like protein